MLKLQILFRPFTCTRAYAISTQRKFGDLDSGNSKPIRDREVIKNVYEESATTASRSQEEINEFYSKHGITVEGETPKPVLTVDELNLPEPLKKVFNNRKITVPTPIQSLCWPLAMSGRDMIGVAQTGSGKTLGYLVPSALHIKKQPDLGHSGPTAVVLAPTRELVQQITTVSQQWLQSSMRINHCGVYGGSSRLVQLNELRRGVKLCVATPGRLIDFINSRELSLSNASYLVLDEADRMLDMGFEPQIRDIITTMRPDRQTVMFSATWPFDVRSLAREFMSKDATRVNIGSTDLCANQNIKQELRFVETDEEKGDILFQLLEEFQGQKVLIFCATKRRVTNLAINIIRSGIRCVESHGDLSQMKRERSLQLFKGPCNVMIATDVAARGLDVQDIKLVVNFDFPQTNEDYVHRIGRTGRCDAQGKSVTFFTPAEKPFARGLVDILKQTQQEVPEQLYDYVDEKLAAPDFRRKHIKKPTNFRLDKASNWRRYAKGRY